ncbi:hypothetical protein DQK91_16355 [Oceanidesulfovibrio marinus]|uniref:Uncharacterized protein n=2 Tax=Oceanidesulfovibrio marinus TaxID=370038 RepID=A0A6P1ZFK5_9BACT|nr:hypothetical protein DQK91_16355 [Oceanidesulfovibrio marinus]
MVRVDIRNSITSLSILQVEAIMNRLPPGGSIEILCDDESFVEDLKRIRKDCCFDHINFEVKGPYTVITFVLKRTTHKEM